MALSARWTHTCTPNTGAVLVLNIRIAGEPIM